MLEAEVLGNLLSPDLLPVLFWEQRREREQRLWFGVAELLPWSQLVPEQVAGDHTCPGPGLVLPDMLPQTPVGKDSQVDLGKEACLWKGDTQACLTFCARWQQERAVMPRQGWGA